MRKISFKNTKIKFIASSEGSDILSATMRISFPDSRVLRIQCQASLPGPCERPFKSFFESKYCGFYAAKINTTARLDGSHFGDFSAQNCTNIMKLLNKTIESKNINFKYPNCEASQILDALVSLGSSFEKYLDAEINGSSLAQYAKDQNRLASLKLAENLNNKLETIA